jgi:glycosyltransferase involved in cell wall biosynthesis
MNICIWFKTTEAAWGGSNSFLRSLAQEFKRLGHTISHVPSLTDDVVLVNSWSLGTAGYLHPGQVVELINTGRVTPFGRLLPPSFWYHLRRARGNFTRSPLVVHRVDGVAQLYGRKDPRADQIQFAIARLADEVIFQSRYTQDSFTKFGVIPSKVHVILNAVDGALYYPADRSPLPHYPLRLVATSWSANPMKGFYWLPLLAELPGIEVRFIGNWCPTIKPGKVQRLGVMTANQIAIELRQSDIFVHAAENDPCSNAILEALACGLPVLYRSSGGNPELAEGYGLPLHEPLGTLADEFRDKYTGIRQAVLNARSTFLIQDRAKKYMSVFEEGIENRK